MSALLGHDSQVAALREAAASGKLHHAWLLAGSKGVGKASFARAAALWLLAEAAGPKPAGEGLDVPAEHPAARLIAAGSHPDYRFVEREVWDSKGNIIPKQDRSGDEKPGRNIRIAQIRWLTQMMATTASMSSRRVIVIDSADDLEAGAANALLKILEEPPAGTIFLLVSHAPGRLLPTIRSRCRLLRFSGLDDAAMTSALLRELPQASEAEIAALAQAAEGAPGEALRFAGLDIAGMDATLRTIAATGDPTTGERGALARSLGAKSAQPRYEAFLERVPAFIAAEARKRSGIALADAIAAWEAARDLTASAVPLSLDAQAVAFELGGLIARLAPRRPALRA